jgi:hypothetical protein
MTRRRPPAASCRPSLAPRSQRAPRPRARAGTAGPITECSRPAAPSARARSQAPPAHLPRARSTPPGGDLGATREPASSPPSSAPTSSDPGQQRLAVVRRQPLADQSAEQRLAVVGGEPLADGSAERSLAPGTRPVRLPRPAGRGRLGGGRGRARPRRVRPAQRRGRAPLLRLQRPPLPPRWDGRRRCGRDRDGHARGHRARVRRTGRVTEFEILPIDNDFYRFYLLAP